MKVRKFFMLGLFASALCLTGCNNNGNNSNQGGGNNPGSGGEENPPELSLLDTLKAKAKSMAADILNESESKIKFADYESDTSDADVYYYDSTNLTFVDIEIYKSSYDTSLADDLVEYLPSNAELDYKNDNFDYEEYGMMFYDRYYSDDEFTYDIYVEAYDEYEDEPAETFGCIFIFETSQQDAFDEYMTSEE